MLSLNVFEDISLAIGKAQRLADQFRCCQRRSYCLVQIHDKIEVKQLATARRNNHKVMMEVPPSEI